MPKASITQKPNQLRIRPNFLIRVDSVAFCSPSPNGRKFVRDSETFVEVFSFVLKCSKPAEYLKKWFRIWPQQILLGPYSGYIRMEFGRIRGGIWGILGRFWLIRIVRGGTTESSNQIDPNNTNRAESAQNATNSFQNTEQNTGQ